MDWGLLVRNDQSSNWVLRSQRLYPWKCFYWIVLVINTVLRFCWTLSFVPFHHLSSSGVLTTNFSNEAWANILVATIALAEIIRRSLWGLLRMEWEAIKVKTEMNYSTQQNHFDNKDDFEMTPMKVHDNQDSWSNGMSGSTLLNRQNIPKFFFIDMSSMNKIHIFGELCLYTTTFAVLGLVIAAHRGTL
jgi:EXS family